LARSQKPLGERLVEAGLLTAEDLVRALEHQRQEGGRLGECILALELMPEGDLLRFLAAHYNTRYVATHKLAKVRISPEVLAKIPRRMAENHAILPILVDTARKVISVVMAEPQDEGLIDEVRLLAEMDEVFAYIGSRTGILAAVRKHYLGDGKAFEAIPSAVEENSGGHSLGLRRIDAEREEEVPPPPEHEEGATGVRHVIDEVHRTSLMSDNDFIETLHILVGLGETRRKDLRNHSASVARHASTVARKLGLPGRDVNHVIIAAYLHDLGKRVDHHLTLMSIQTRENLKAEAGKFHRMPTKIFETVHLPIQVNATLAHLYECFDGSGLPQGVRGDAIPLGARIIAAIDCYEDLTKNSRNVFGGQLGKREALKEMQAHSGKLFDPEVLEVLELLHSGELLRERLQGTSRRLLLVDRDAKSSGRLETQLIARGYTVETVRGSGDALTALRAGGFSLVISEVDLGGESGFALAFTARREVGREVPFIFLTAQDDQKVLQEGASVGARDILIKPVDIAALEGKISRLLAEQAALAPPEIVQGTLDELPVESVLRTIAAAKRSGALQIEGDRISATAWFDSGKVVQISCGHLDGDEAFLKLLEIQSGDFTVDPNAQPPYPTQRTDVEVLLKAAGATRKPKARDFAGLPTASGRDRKPVPITGKRGRA
jgi:putative nucleotidyltransferase with HDIG domain